MMRVKKVVALVMALLIFSLTVPFGSAFAADSGYTVTLTADRISVTNGDTVTLTLLVSDINVTGGLLSIDVPFRYDTSVFDYVGKTVIYPTEWTEPDDYSYTTPKNGLLWLRALDVSGNLTANGCSRDNAIGFTVTLKVKDNAPVCVSAVTINGDGVFEVISGTAADGMCSEVGGTGNSVGISVTDGTGALLGDVNGDEEVDNLDALLILKYDAGISDFTEAQLSVGDMNGDGEVDNLDALTVLKIDAGLI